MNAEWGGRQIQRQLAGGTAVSLEAVKAANPSSHMADGVQIMDGAVEVSDFVSTRLAPASSAPTSDPDPFGLATTGPATPAAQQPSEATVAPTPSATASEEAAAGGPG